MSLLGSFIYFDYKNLEPADKPDSVLNGDLTYAAYPEGRRATSSPPYLALLAVGFA